MSALVLQKTAVEEVSQKSRKCQINPQQESFKRGRVERKQRRMSGEEEEDVEWRGSRGGRVERKNSEGSRGGKVKLWDLCFCDKTKKMTPAMTIFFLS